MSLNRANVVSTTPISSKVIVSVVNYNGTKVTSTLYLEDTSDTNSELQKLNIEKFDSISMLNEESVVVQKRDKEGLSQLFYGKINATDDQLQQVTNFTRNIYGFNFVQSTNTLFYSMTATDPVKSADGAVFMLYNDTNVRNTNGFVKPSDEVIHIFSAKYSINDGNMTIGSSTDIFDKFDKRTTITGFQVTENGEWIGFTAPSNTLLKSDQDDWNNNLFLVPTNMTQQPFQVSDTQWQKNMVSSFVFGTDGKKVLWTVKDFPNANVMVGFWSYDINTRFKKSLLKGFDHTIDILRPISENFFAFGAMENDVWKVFTCDMLTDTVVARTDDDANFVLISFLANSHKLIAQRSNFLTTPDLSIIDINNWKSKPLINVNPEFKSHFEMHKAEKTSFKGWNNETVTGFIHKPAGFDPSKKYPAMVMVHGGPNFATLNAWIDGNVWNPAIFAAAGYFVIITNFHGSTGHGKNFMESVYGQWGGNAYEDVMQGLDEALKKYTQIDSKRVCAMGASYGGYMTNWLSGKSPERFACFITHAGLFDLDSMYLTGPFGKFDKDLEFTAPGSKDVGIPDLSKYSPAKYTNNWVKPTLVSHGGMDTNVPIDQGLAAFTALQYRNITSKFLYFPTESHVVADPPNVAVQIDAYLDWLNTYTKV